MRRYELIIVTDGDEVSMRYLDKSVNNGFGYGEFKEIDLKHLTVKEIVDMIKDSEEHS
jgi:hypothetical protein